MKTYIALLAFLAALGTAADNNATAANDTQIESEVGKQVKEAMDAVKNETGVEPLMAINLS